MNKSGARSATSDLIESSPYDIGYKKPPGHSRFKKGQSGNPKGRPKAGLTHKAKKHRALRYELPEEGLKQTFLKEAYRLVNINTSQGEESIPISQAIIRALGVKAAKGHIGAQRLFAQTLLELEAAERKNSEARMGWLIDYKKQWTSELERRESNNLPLDPPVPHPDDIFYDMQSGTMEIRGPLCEDEKAKLDHYRDLLQQWQKSTADYQSKLDNYKSLGNNEFDGTQTAFLKEQVEQGENITSMLMTLIGDKEPKGLWEVEKARRKSLQDHDP